MTTEPTPTPQGGAHPVSAGEALPANADRIHSALVAARSALREQADYKSAATNDEISRRVTNGFIADQLSHVLDDYEALRAPPQPSEQAIDLPTHMNAMCEHLCARISNWIGAVAVNGSLSGPADDACKELLRNTFTALQDELTYLKALREADEPAAPDDDAGVAALRRALEVYFSVCGEVADTASLAAVITDRRSMCVETAAHWCIECGGIVECPNLLRQRAGPQQARPVAAGSAAITEAVVAKGCAAEIEHEKLPLDHRHYMRRTNRVRAILEGAFMGDPPQDVSVEYYQSLPIVEDRTAHPEPAAAEPAAFDYGPHLTEIAAILGARGFLRAARLLRQLRDERKAPSASAPSQPSEGPARVTERIELILPDVIGILPLLKGVATFGEFGDLEYDGGSMDRALANAIGILTELKELAALAAAEGKG